MSKEMSFRNAILAHWGVTTPVIDLQKGGFVHVHMPLAAVVATA